MMPKYRAWDKHKKEMLEVGAINWYMDEIVIYDENVPFFSIKLDYIILMQSTGIKDKKGSEIYEGDVVEHLDGEWSFTGEVKVSIFGSYIKNKHDCYDFENIADENSMSADCLVMGNIYENPELKRWNDEI